MSDAAAFDAFEAAGWEEAASGYERFLGPITARLIEPVLDAAQVGRGTRLLDVACGPGHLTARAASRGAVATGVDVAAAMVDLASARHPAVAFRRADAQRLPFAAASFDAVVANFAVLHLGDSEQAATEFARVLSPGGRVAVTVWDQPERARLFAWILEAIDDAGAEPPADLPAGPAFFRFAADDQLAGLLEHGGFGDVTIRTVEFTQPAASSSEIWDGVVGGTVRTAALVNRQPTAVERRIRAAFDRLIESARRGDVIEIPFSVKLASGAKPT
ncbi:MAG: class I SAM-dependent methyltransferase [Jiangellaceae bacterium]